MTIIKKIRLQLGLSQRQMANLLGIPRSVCAMAETGKRSLPTAVLLKLSEMELFFNDPRKTSNEAINSKLKDNDDAIEKAFDMELANLAHESLKLSKQINQQEEQYEKAELRLQWIYFQLTQPNLLPKTRLWLEILALEASDLLTPTHAVALAKLKLEKKAIDFKIQELKAMLS
ncbi:MAG: helix-turn-helix domain-containing protein [Cytophagales bacterium]